MAKNTKSLGIIPARFASTRFPGKPLVDILGKTMIRRVFEQASQAGISRVVVATDDERIFNHVKNFSGEVVMTSPDHLSGTDRCAEIANLPRYADFEIIVNIQGDEPFIRPGQIDQVVEFLVQNETFSIATLARQISNQDELFNPNVVKVVFDNNQQALYFSRAAIPFLRNIPQETWLREGEFYKHIGLYAFRRQVLVEIAALPVGGLEKNESLEQLRWLENGYKIGIALTDFESFGIDTPDDLLHAFSV
mgnify:FL=1